MWYKHVVEGGEAVGEGVGVASRKLPLTEPHERKGREMWVERSVCVGGKLWGFCSVYKIMSYTVVLVQVFIL